MLGLDMESFELVVPGVCTGHEGLQGKKRHCSSEGQLSLAIWGKLLTTDD